MSQEDEARYVRMCLFVLNICPYTLRRVIDNCYTAFSLPSLEVFLDSRKHDLFHLAFKRCCCRPFVSYATPMYRSQWDLLFTRTTTVPIHYHLADCPCQYKASPGIMTDVLDITLCCLLIRNLCPGVNLADVDTIRNTRNQLIHARDAILDEPSFNAAWSSVEGAVMNLAHSVSPLVEADTRTKVQELKHRIMNTADLTRLRDLLIDQTHLDSLTEDVGKLQLIISKIDRTLATLVNTADRVAELEVNTSNTAYRVTELEDATSNTADRVTELENAISNTAGRFTELEVKTSNTVSIVASHSREIQGVQQVQQETQRIQGQHGRQIQDLEEMTQKFQGQGSQDFPAEKINKLRKELIEFNYAQTQRIQVSPFENFDKKMPIDQLFAPVIIKEHRAEGASNSSQERELINNFEDMFFKNSQPVKYIFMQGEAAHGKTTYCLNLLHYWCNAKRSGESSEILTGWEKGLDSFDLVFYVPLRHADEDTSSIIEMICNDTYDYSLESKEAIRHVLPNGKYRCLIIVDGLDEWKYSDKAGRELRLQGIPNIKDLENCTLLITSRPWKFEVIAQLLTCYDRVIEIEGLHKKGTEAVIKNVLANYFEENSTSFDLEFKRISKEIEEKSKTQELKSMMQIPLLVIVAVPLLYRRDSVGNTMTTFYKALVRMLIEYTREKKPHDCLDSQNFTEFQSTASDIPGLKIPDILQRDSVLKEYFVALNILGETAYEDVISRETHLVFDKSEIERKLGQPVLHFALTVGLLSQCEAPCSCRKQISVNFLHKSIQEFLAAVRVSSSSDVSESFRKQLISITTILELSNVILFTSGLSPSMGRVLAKQIVHVANDDEGVCRYRETFDRGTCKKLELLYDLQLRCYNEMKQGQSVLQRTEPLTYHVSDVYLYISGGEKLRASVDLMFENPTHIVSLYLAWISNDENGITDIELTQILDHTTSLQYLCISGRLLRIISDRFTSLKTLYLSLVSVTRFAMYQLKNCLQHNKVLTSLTLMSITCVNDAKTMSPSLYDILSLPQTSLRSVLLCLPNSPCLSTLHMARLYDTENVQTAVAVLPKLRYLRRIQYDGNMFTHPDADAAVVHTVSRMKGIQHLQLERISLGDKSLELTSEMSQIRTIKFVNVKMSAQGWNKFVHSLINMPHRFSVILEFTYIDYRSLTMIRSSPHFIVTKDEWWMTEFVRVVSSPQHTL